MKAVILAGGRGTRITEESVLRPKPMIEIGGRPILWHIMKLYQSAGINDFVICLGYKGYMIKEYFANYFLHSSDVTFHVRDNRMEVHSMAAEPWSVTLVDTGADSMTGGRIKRVAPYLTGGDFCLTYGDGVSDLDIKASIAFHKEHNRLATVTAVQPVGRYGSLAIDGDNGHVSAFVEKPPGDGNWVNAGFFVLSPRVIDYLAGDHVVFEQEPMAALARDDQLRAFRHHGFWQSMDTVRDKALLEDLWSSGSPPWKTWA